MLVYQRVMWFILKHPKKKKTQPFQGSCTFRDWVRTCVGGPWDSLAVSFYWVDVGWYIPSSTRTRRGGSCLKDIYNTFLIYRTCMRRAPAKPVRACTLRNWCLVSHVTFQAPLHTSHLTVFTLHTTHFTLHSSHCTLHTAPFAVNTSLHTVLLRLHTSHFTLHTPHFTLHTALFAVQTSHFTLHTSLFTLHSSHSKLHTSQSTLHTSHFSLLSSHSTLHTSHCTLHAPHFTL